MKNNPFSMRILTVATNAVPGFMGGELRVALDLSNGYIKAGHKCDILTYGTRTEVMADAWTMDDLHVKKIQTPMDHVDHLGLSSRTLLLKPAANFDKELRKIISNYDIVHVHNIHSPNLIKSLVNTCSKTGPKIIWTVHDDWFETASHSWIKRHISPDFNFSMAKRLKLSVARRRMKIVNDLVRHSIIVAPSNAMKIKIQNHFGSKVAAKIIYNGVKEVQSTYNPHSLVFTYVGHLGESKGVKTLLGAFRSITQIHPNISLNIIGTGPLDDWVHSYVKKNQLENNVSIMGQLSHDNAGAIIGKSRCVILPSEGFENCSMVILEAMACGVPIIASNIGGNVELVKDGENGYIFEGGITQSLEDAMERCIAATPASLTIISNNCLARHKNEFNVEKMIESYLDLF